MADMNRPPWGQGASLGEACAACGNRLGRHRAKDGECPAQGRPLRKWERPVWRFGVEVRPVFTRRAPRG